MENCNNKATHTRTELFKSGYRTIKGKFKTEQLGKMKTTICKVHKQSLKRVDVTHVSLDTI